MSKVVNMRGEVIGRTTARRGLLEPERPRLAAALACATAAPAAWWDEKRIAGSHVAFDATHAWLAWPQYDEQTSRKAWTITDAREAWEAMATAGLIAYDAVDDWRRRFEGPSPLEAKLREDLGRLRGRTLSRDTQNEAAEIASRALESVCFDPHLAAPFATRVAGRRLDFDFDWQQLHAMLPPAALAREPRSHPATMAGCVALASDWPGALAAEAIVRGIEYACPTCLGGGGSLPAWLRRPSWLQRAGAPTEPSPDEARHCLECLGLGSWRVERVVWRLVAREAYLRGAARRFGSNGAVATLDEGVVLGVHAHGYAIDALEGGTAVLACPTLDGGEPR